jgi:high-affinity nickel-transport protein
MLSLLSLILVGFFLGMRHATDPDHVIAVTTIVTRRKSVRHAALIGVLWGLGHTITIFLVGMAIILFSVVIPVRVGLAMELSVGLMLILLGALNLTGVMRWISERFTAPAETPSLGAKEIRVSASTPPTSDPLILPGWRGRALRDVGVFQMVRPLFVGIVHGLAGSAAVALMVLTTIQNPWWALAYLLVFGFGTVAGMMVITSAIAMPIAYSGQRFAGFGNMLAIASGVLSVGFGCFLAYQIGFVNGLLTDHPHWTPR